MRKVLLLIPTLAIGAMLVGAINFAALASARECGGEWHGTPRATHERMQARLGQFARALDLKAAQQPGWDAFASAVAASADPPPPAPNADASAIMHVRPDRGNDCTGSRDKH